MSILRADSIRDRAGTGAPDFPNGLTGTLTGNVTGTASNATAAQGLTGTPNITVGTVAGTDATFSGNLTVQGTTTTIDTAVISLDSLQIDGNVAIGTITAGRHLTVSGGASEGAIQITNNTSGHSAANGFELIHFTSGETQFLNRESGDMRFDTNGGEKLRIRSNGNIGLGTLSPGSADAALDIKKDNADIKLGNPSGQYHRLKSLSTGEFTINDNDTAERFRITSGGTAIFKAGLAEKYTKGTTLAAASNNVALSSGNVHRFTSNESGAQTVNFTGVHATLGDGESVSFTVLVTPANSGYINAVTIDGVTPGGGLKWSGGSAPSAGSSGRDVYTFTIFKDGTATNSYEVFGAATNYA